MIDPLLPPPNEIKPPDVPLSDVRSVGPLQDRMRAKVTSADFDIWQEQVMAIAPLGNAALMDFCNTSLAAADKFGPEHTLHIGRTCLHIEEVSSGDNARHLLRNALNAIATTADGATFEIYLDCLVTVARQSPLMLPPLIDTQAQILPVLQSRHLEHWIGTGLAIASWDRDDALAYFQLQSEDARNLLDQMSGEVDFDTVATSVRSFIRALWGISPICVSFVPDDSNTNLQRSSFFHSLIRMPSRYAGVSGELGEQQFRGAFAHIAAHLVFGQGPQEIGSLKPVQVALISLIEDARVEQLASLELPGLGKLWAGLHTAKAGKTTTVNKLLARLARALADPDYHDENTWVRRGQQLFFQDSAQWQEPDFSRKLGGLLGNDLGQMRIPFNARAYVVQPSYRDDNSGLWVQKPDETDPEQTEDEFSVLSSPDEPDQSKTTQVAQSASKDAIAELGRYSEWDFELGAYRHAWCRVKEYAVVPAPVAAVERVLTNEGGTITQVERLLRETRVGRPKRVRGQSHGDIIDIDACIRFVGEKRAGLTPDPRIYQISQISERELSVFVLLDISQSTRNRVGQTADTILSIERSAASILGLAMQRVGDAFEMAGFCSDGRNDVRIYPVKDFTTPFDMACLCRLNGLRGGLSTRLGAALRYCGSRLATQKSERKLVLVITDGEPSDRDVTDDRYLTEDARQAVSALRSQGIDTFAVALGSDGIDTLPRIFSRRNYQVIDRVQQLPERLTRLYHQLAR
ncbi:hypothetical protein B9057_16535 (plasmid) [Aestuarium zhoushanense]|nr:hypothetical protein B9057_16535 [Aestuarium zhoushanense]